MDTHDQPSPEHIAIYRRMTPGRRLEVAEQLYWSARRSRERQDGDQKLAGEVAVARKPRA